MPLHLLNSKASSDVPRGEQCDPIGSRISPVANDAVKMPVLKTLYIGRRQLFRNFHQPAAITLAIALSIGSDRNSGVHAF